MINSSLKIEFLSIFITSEQEIFSLFRVIKIQFNQRQSSNIAILVAIKQTLSQYCQYFTKLNTKVQKLSCKKIK